MTIKPADVVLDPLEASVERQSNRDAVVLPVLFSVTAFTGAALLFVVEPLVAKLLLPDYGGSATVWSTSTLFFQVLLLAAYGYCHVATRAMRGRLQPWMHHLVVLLPLLALPLGVPTSAAPPADAAPALWLLRTLGVMVGLPFAVVATTGPMLQWWYAVSGGRRSDDPYFLFAASNLGSFVGLLAYPFVIEPHVSLAGQEALWSGSYVVFLCLIALCGAAAWLRAGRRRGSWAPTRPGSFRSPGPSVRRRLLWAAVAFLPASLMLGVTAHVSTDVAAIPLLWVVPLALYLGSFVLAFARRSRSVPVAATRAAVGLVLLAALLAVGPATVPTMLNVALSMLLLSLVAYASHCRLAVDRPATEHLTGFYLWVAVGGALGGLLNGLVAPVVFDSVLEYPLVLACVPLLLAGLPGDSWLARQLAANRVRASLVLVGIAVAAVALRLVLAADGNRAVVVISVALSGSGLAWFAARRAVSALVATLAVLLVVQAFEVHGTVEQTRTFYGVYRVYASHGSHSLVHGTTLHGTQFQDAVRHDVPTTYYSRRGPLGDIFAVADAAGARDVAAVGLGAGTLASYGRPGQRFTFVEIDPAVVRIATDPQFFTFLSDSRADVRTVVGDGRLVLRRQAKNAFDLVVLDAFSSDAIPVHLLTREAMAMYAARVRAGGMIAVHITNRTFDLEPVLAATAHDLGWSAVVRHGTANGPGAAASTWVALAAEPDQLAPLLRRPGWRHLRARRVTWTDDYSSVLSVLR